VTRLDLTDCTAIITGASRGIGLAVAQAISAAGGNVVLTSRRQESVDAAAAEINGNALGVAAHAVDEQAAKRCIDLTLERFASTYWSTMPAPTRPSAR
jgi:NAD(P)-dependent dehydrogenase (short-subunit alcohol dehydrogenase family)